MRQHSLDDIEQRAKRFLNIAAEAFSLPIDRRDLSVENDRTLIRLPLGAQLTAYHASGAIQLVTGLNPMESLFEDVEERERLLELVKGTTSRLNIREWVGKNESLNFEQLWQIKAAAADQKGQTVKPVLCRVVGAYRHFVGELPILGAASVAVKLANKGTLDSLTVQVRETIDQVIDRVEILPPEQAARQIFLQLSSRMGESKIPISNIAAPKWMRFGYLSLTKRKAQRLLAPVYLAAIEIEGQEEAQAYLFATPATEKTYLPLSTEGSEPPTVAVRRAA
ncbi:hypothetical protein [Cylindrospermum stagnale]|uniref:hypothetical protein n=1 Tax=Cylindrospermum stagnale TaxID=142864 RepID=UPI0012F663F1|nr:hypothetical protein [Cylindrospermum stagnale]